MLMFPSRTLTTAAFVGMILISGSALAASCIRFAQLVPDAPLIANTVTFAPTADPGNVVSTFADLQFLDVTDYRRVDPGGYQVRVQVGNFPPQTRVGRLFPETDHTALAFGEFIAAADSPQALDEMLLADDNRLAPPGQARLRAIHLGSDSGVLDVVVDGTPLFSALSYTEPTDYRTITAGEHTVAFVDADGPVVTPTTLTLAEGSVTSLLLVGLTQRLGNLTALAITDAPNACTEQHYEGIWFDPAQNGQGVQLVHNGSSLSGVWYVYDSDGSTAWFTFVGMLQANTFDAELLRFDGPPLAGVFDPTQVVSRPVGTVSIVFSTTTHSARFTATIGTANRVLNLVPFGS